MNPESLKKLDLIFGRRSVRVYSPGEVNDPALELMLKAAMAAPSAMTKDPWRFVIVREPSSLQQLASALPGGKMLPAAALAIVVCGDLDAAFERNAGYLLQDCSACVENLLLAIHGLGYGGCWIGIYPADDSVKKVKQQLALPAPVLPIACIAVGLPGEQLDSRTRFNAEYVHCEKWDQGCAV